MAIFLYKLDRFGQIQWLTNTIIEYSKRRWLVNVGDIILFSRGSGDELHFFGTSNVLSVEVEEQNQISYNEGNERVYATKLQIDAVKLLPSDRTLGAFMFSLIRVSNFSKPYLNFRHLGRIDERDLRILISGTIDIRRSLYFGLLRNLPANWRAYLEYRSMAEGVATNHHEKDQKLPIYELWELINKLVLQPLEIGSETEPLFRKFFERMGLKNPYVEARHPDYDNSRDWLNGITASRWNLTKFIKNSPSLLQDIQPDLNILNEFLLINVDLISIRRDEIKEWRPHKW